MSTAFSDEGSLPDSSDQDDREPLDQRVQFELERLNTATELINKLEIELDEARSNFRLLLSESSQKINQLAKKLGSHVEKARPYYEARMKVKELEDAARKASLRHERASLAHCTARQMVALAEEGLRRQGAQGSLDPVFQEMLNQATVRVNEAERERVVSRAEQGRLWHACKGQQQTVLDLHQALKKSIVKASLSARRSLLQLNNLANQHELQLLPYFEMKAQLNEALEEQKKRVFHMEEDVMRVKFSYTEALHNLEQISDQMHHDRLLMPNSSSSGSSLLSSDDCCGRGSSDDGFAHAVGDGFPQRLVKSSSLSSSEMLKIYEDICSEETYQKLPEPRRTQRHPAGIRRAFSEGGHQPAMCPSPSPASQHRGLVSSLVDRVFPTKPSQTQVREEKPVRVPQSAVPTLKQLVAAVIDQMFPDTTQCNGNEEIRLDLTAPARNNNGAPGVPLATLATLEDLSPVIALDIEASLAKAARRLTLDGTSQRLQTVEEGSDTDSLLSTGTGGTLDDRQIDCLLLDRVLEQDYQEVLNSCRDSSHL
ncbi:SH3 domain-binding protein 5-like isoform X1 [Dermacentor albipictus]|uniref:SH3 domain-binding protein 5-like isoform X1 n=1 Tax=Dermacentor albipictus TaxID=60249 RepID=UPI0031FC27F6